jgi:hypothetical protein
MVTVSAASFSVSSCSTLSSSVLASSVFAAPPPSWYCVDCASVDHAVIGTKMPLVKVLEVRRVDGLGEEVVGGRRAVRA